jgi:hypothetical protein
MATTIVQKKYALPNVTEARIHSSIIGVSPAYGKYKLNIAAAGYRAFLAGARLPLHFLGIGMTAVVFCDNKGIAWKVGRNTTKSLFLLLEREYEYLKAAGRMPSISRNIVRVYNWYPQHVAFSRECLWGTPGRWADQTVLWNLFGKITGIMEKNGWSGPEFKEDSFVFTKDKRTVLVDGGFSYRIGKNLVKYAREVLAGRRPIHDEHKEIAFDLRREVSYKAVPKRVAESLTRKLGVSGNPR